MICFELFSKRQLNERCTMEPPKNSLGFKNLLPGCHMCAFNQKYCFQIKLGKTSFEEDKKQTLRISKASIDQRLYL